MSLNFGETDQAWEGLVDPFTGEPLPGKAGLSMDTLRHFIKRHLEQPIETVFGEQLSNSLRQWMQGEARYRDFPPSWLAQAQVILHEEVANSLHRKWAVGYEIEGKPYRKVTVVLRAGAIVPLSIGSQVRVNSLYFHTGSIRETRGEIEEKAQARWRKGAATHLVTEHCPRCQTTWKRYYPRPGDVKVTRPAEGDGERRRNIRYANLAFFGWVSDEPGSEWTERPDVRVH